MIMWPMFLHCENPLKAEQGIDDYELKAETFDITDVDKELVDEIPRETQIGKSLYQIIIEYFR